MSKITKTPTGLRVPDAVTIPFITGDGIGKEITPVCRAVVDAAVKQAFKGNRSIEWLEVEAGQEAFKKRGSYLPEETVAAFKEYRVGLKGPLNTPAGRGVRSLNVALRQALDLYACVRPFRYFYGVYSPVKYPERIDITVFRENTEDVYAGIEWPFGSENAEKFSKFLCEELKETKVRFPETAAYGVKPVSKEGTERLVRRAIQYALDHHRRSVTLVHNGNIMKYTEGAFCNWAYELAEREFGPYLSSGRLVVTGITCDAFLQNAISNPDEYSVIATLNLNGDYISDVLAAQVGGVGMAPSGNINYETGHGIFEGQECGESQLADPFGGDDAGAHRLERCGQTHRHGDGARTAPGYFHVGCRRIRQARQVRRNQGVRRRAHRDDESIFPFRYALDE